MAGAEGGLGATMGTVRVKVEPDVSAIEPAIKAELERLFKKITRDELAAEIAVIGGELADGGAVNAVRIADKLLERFVVIKRGSKAEESDASES